MDIDIYRNFLTVVSCGTISEAARQLNMTQPALSMQIKSLQNNLGQELLIKHQGTHKMELTSAGRMVYKRALELCELEDKLHSEIQQREEGLRGMLNVSVFSWGDQLMMTEIIPAFHKEYPLVKFMVSRTGMQHQSVNNQVDMRILQDRDLPEYKQSFDIILKQAIHLYVAVTDNNPWFDTSLGCVKPEQLQKVPLVVLNKSMTNIVKHYGFESNVVVWSNFRRGILKAAESGVLAGIVLGTTDATEYPKLKFLRLADDSLSYNWVVGKTKGMKLTPLVQRFNEFVLKYRKEHGLL